MSSSNIYAYVEFGMTFAEEYNRLYNNTMKQILEHRDHTYECLLIKQQFEEQKQYLIDKYFKNR